MVEQTQQRWSDIDLNIIQFFNKCIPDQELYEQKLKIKGEIKELRGEAVDVFIAARLAVIYRKKYKLTPEEVFTKTKINLERKWVKDKKGVYHHDDLPATRKQY